MLFSIVIFSLFITALITDKGKSYNMNTTEEEFEEEEGDANTFHEEEEADEEDDLFDGE